ncbi:MAG: hypothetical protein GF307_11070 [candidate division Zixibacteria bacterium]|nr:hypothetical protein [candidate division Zixibacteria bacterium]
MKKYYNITAFIALIAIAVFISSISYSDTGSAIYGQTYVGGTLTGNVPVSITGICEEQTWSGEGELKGWYNVCDLTDTGYYRLSASYIRNDSTFSATVIGNRTQGVSADSIDLHLIYIHSGGSNGGDR